MGQFKLGGATFNSVHVVNLASALGMMAVLHYFSAHTKMGKAMRACSDDIEAAGLMGIDSNRVIAATFLVGGALGGAAGILYGMNYGSIKYNLGFLPGAKAFTAAVLGGIGNIRGAVLGGFILGTLEVMAAGYIPNGAQWRDVIAFGILIIVLLFRPSGILGEKTAEKVWCRACATSPENGSRSAPPWPCPCWPRPPAGSTSPASAASSAFT